MAGSSKPIYLNSLMAQRRAGIRALSSPAVFDVQGFRSLFFRSK